jgi:pilus assembly protein CpaE
MAKSPSVVIIGAQEADETSIRHQIGEVIEIVASVADPGQCMDVIHKMAPNIAVLFLDHFPDAILEASTKVAQINGCTPVIVSRDKNPDNILLAMRSGAKDFAYLEDENLDVRRVLLNLSMAPQETAQPTHRGMVVAVFSCKGGSGATTIASNLAGALMPEGPNRKGQVVLLDLDLQMGDVLAFLDLTSRYTFRDLVANLHRMDEDLLHQSLTLHPFGLHVVAQSDALEEAEDLDPKSVGRSISFLRRHFEYIVIDGVRDFSELSLIAMDLADKVLLTMTQDIPALKNANRCLAVFRQLGYGPDKIKMVVNRYHKRGDLDTDSIADALNMPVEWTVSNDFRTCIKAINEGTLLVDAAPRAQVTKDIRALVPILRGERPSKKKSGLFGKRR